MRKLNTCSVRCFRDVRVVGYLKTTYQLNDYLEPRPCLDLMGLSSTGVTNEYMRLFKRILGDFLVKYGFFF